MQPKTLKALTGIVAVTIVAVAYFVWGCDEGSLLPLLGAILLLAGKEAWELRKVNNGGLG